MIQTSSSRALLLLSAMILGCGGGTGAAASGGGRTMIPVGGAGLGGAAPGGSGGTTQGPGGATSSSGGSPSFTQPTAGLVLAAGQIDGVPQVIYALRGDTQTTTIPVSEMATTVGTTTVPQISALDKATAHPFELLTISGSGFRPGDAAISVLFRSTGSEPVAVPAISATATTVEVAVPPILDANGGSVEAYTTVQVVQVGRWGVSTTEKHDSLTVGTLPQFLTPDMPAGSVLDGYLVSVLNTINTIEESAPGNLPGSFWTALAKLKAEIGTMQSAVHQVVLDPLATPTLPTVGGSGTLALDAKSLALADQMVGALLLRLADGLDLPITEPLPDGYESTTKALTACPTIGYDKWVDETICETQQYSQTLYSKGQAGIALGANVELSFMLAVFGGWTTTVVEELVPAATTAFELVYSGISGHIAAWGSASARPTSGETLGDVAVTVLDKLAGTQGILGTLYSGLRFGKEYDDIIEATPAAAVPDGGLFPNVLKGPFNAITSTVGSCLFAIELTSTLTLNDFSGTGTPTDPYGGNVKFSGTFVSTLLPPTSDSCLPGDSMFFDSFAGTVGGTAGKVVIHGTVQVGSGLLTLDFPAGVWNGTTIKGPITLGVEGATGLDHPFAGTLVLGPP